MRANLHLHSRFSDGTDWPADIAKRAAAAGLRHAALTDHDTLGGTSEFAKAARLLGIKTTAGVEIDCREDSIDYKSELLAYFPDASFGRTSSFLSDICASRLSDAHEAIARAQRHFPMVEIRFEKLLERKRQARSELKAEHFSFNKVDVFLYLREVGAVPTDVDYKSFKAAYFDSRLLGTGRKERPSCAEVARVVRSDGGILVVPHIGHEFGNNAERLERETGRLNDLLNYFRLIGVSGIELYWYRNRDTASINKIVRKAAKRYGFFTTYGSDCHGPGSGKETLGEFSGNFSGFAVVQQLS